MKLSDLVQSGAPDFLDEVMLSEVGVAVEVLQESRKWVTGRFERNIGIDQPTHLAGDGKQHAHVLGRKGEELGVVNVDGSSRHGTKFKLHDTDADELRRRGFKIRADNLVEWLKLGLPRTQVLFG